MSHILIQTTLRRMLTGMPRLLKSCIGKQEDKEWLSKDEAMEFLNVTSSTLDNLDTKD